MPLANELTSAGSAGEDSWRHYMTLAEQAAAKADELGREMIEVGLQDDIRKEAAGEVVGELCGAYGTTETVKTDGTSLDIPSEDKGSRRASAGRRSTSPSFGTIRSPPEYAAQAASVGKSVDQAIWDRYATPPSTKSGGHRSALASREVRRSLCMLA